MLYASRVLDLLLVWQRWLGVIAGVLLLEVVIIVLLRRRRAGTVAPRLLMGGTLALAISASLLFGYVTWQVHMLDPHIPFTRLPDGSIEYMPPPIVVLVTHGGPALILGAILVLLLEGAMLIRSLTSAATATPGPTGIPGR
jgi:hypothetical protein